MNIYKIVSCKLASSLSPPTGLVRPQNMEIYWENHDEENTTQIYYLKIDYWMGKFDDEEELGEWMIEIRHERSSFAQEVPFELWFDVYYYEE